MSYKVVFVEAMVMVIVLMGTLLYFENRSVIRKRPALNVFYIVSMLQVAAEIACIIAEGNPKMNSFNLYANVIGFTLMGFVGYCWFLTLFDYLPLRNSRIYKYRRFASIPALVCMVLSVLSIFGIGIAFSVSPAGVYTRGPLFMIPSIVDFIYITGGSYYSLKCKKAAQFTNDKNKFGSIAVFPIPMYIMGIIQIFLPAGLPTAQFGVLAGMIILYGSNQNNRITRDHLTNLPNRIAFEKILQKKIERYSSSNPNKLFILAGDLNDFKKINDTYGHPEGDRALMLAGKVLEMNLSTDSGVVARTGVDEFMAVIEAYEDNAINSIIRSIDKDLKTCSRDTKYDLSMSIGVYQYVEGTSFSDAIKIADEKLYKIKKALKGE